MLLDMSTHHITLAPSRHTDPAALDTRQLHTMIGATIKVWPDG
jgi:hypothetical protein